MSAEQTKLTDWTEKARQADLNWIQENLECLRAIANSEEDEKGPGAILVNTTLPMEETGYRYFYLPQSGLEEMGIEEYIQPVQEYDPKKELVIILIKAPQHTATYKVSFSNGIFPTGR